MFEQIEIWLAAFVSDGAGNLLTALLILLGGILVIRIVMTILRKFLEKSKLEIAAHTLIKSLVRVVLYLLLGLMVADSVGIDVTGIIALASVLTLSVSLALQNALANVFGGFTLLYTAPFHSGDFVDIGAESGTVVEIGMAYTKLRTPDNKMISIPNSTVAAGDIINYSVTGTRRVDISVTAVYTADSQKVLDTLLRAAAHDKVLLDPAPAAVIDSYGDNTIRYALRVWTKTEDYWDVRNAVMLDVKNLFDAQGIKMVYPHIHVYTEN
ncbi:MAG: mechanosensitive ion channel family protein [Oscillospiraceae bacterium]|nr:mechanosensitive ion channel family protein [Oscillospiraceae bacterium]